MENQVFLLDYNNVSMRWAIFEDDGVSGWFYLTETSSKKIIADCWIYNRIEAPHQSEIINIRNTPPPATIEYTGLESYVCKIENNIKFKWSNSGEDVALLINDKAIGYILKNNKRGFSKNLLKEGPWGNLFNSDKYFEVFEK